jgi:predicted metalloprotease with PDZ domain
MERDVSMLLPILLLLQASALAAAPTDTVRYEVTFPNAAHHEAEIVIEYTGLPPGPLELRMSRSSPGRYALHEFAKNVYGVHATDGGGRRLRITRPNPHQWNVEQHDGTVRVRYTLFGDRADGTYTGIDRTHAHLNMPATFMWARGTGDRPIRVRFDVPPGANWRAATQLRPTADAFTYTAPDLDWFMDSPTELSDFDLREWTVASNGRTYRIRIALHHRGTEQELDRYADMAQSVVAEQIAVFGELPDFDYGTYTFIADYLPWVSGDGMEHRNSTVLTGTTPLASGALGNLGTLSHEFFHAWNVERIRPRALEPFDFEEANMSGELWFAEGFTSYYDDLFIRRAGLTDDARYAEGLSGGLNAVINGPGRRWFSPVEMSMQAPFVDAAASIDPHNRDNTFISYYTWGSVIGLGLDLTLRTRFPGVTLDDYMRALWRAHGKIEAPYTLPDLRQVLGDVTGDAAFAREFFERYILGRDVVDYAPLLARAGFLLRPANPGVATVGAAHIAFREGIAVVATPPLIGSPLYEAGVALGDRIVSIGGQPLASAAQLERFLAGRRPGDAAEITFEQRGASRTARLTLAEDDRLEVVAGENVGLPLTDEARRFRAAWLGSRATPQSR